MGQVAFELVCCGLAGFQQRTWGVGGGRWAARSGRKRNRGGGVRLVWGEQWGTRGAALCRQSGVSLGTAGELGTEDFMLGKEHRSVLAGRCLSRHPPPPLPQAALSLQVATSPCQVLILFWDAEPASGGGGGLGAPPPAGILRVWEAGAGPGKTGHQSSWAIPSGHGQQRAPRSQQSAKYRDTRRWKWFLLATGGCPAPSQKGRDEALGNRVCGSQL